MPIGKHFAKDPMGRVAVVLGFDFVNKRMHLGTRERDTISGQLKEKTVFANSYEVGYGIINNNGTGRCCDTDPSWYDPWEIDDITWRPFRELCEEVSQNDDVSSN